MNSVLWTVFINSVQFNVQFYGPVSNSNDFDELK